MDTTSAPTTETRPPPASACEPRLIPAQTLFGPSQVVHIEYRGERYQLRQTRNGKLILTK